ncbi:hypothetical protein A3J56_03015 [Candidatus Giovannonibacteria bacterium RIFCSPHIGHO2_02_FULL_46_20]|uniref:Uncharacterized protein n=1 Tax=Candidatus Giovannonibacteria bacterium RIFCSPHIGHO2_02_FULL_46_20 TaxID=1798338 RepID=A0A1F5WGJ8_9BACT|nr:MAG: hypothetical protein A3J56_03015 [Candidatus Giovannonibacteria bacterium RIFCSPHIGHO2_02_FULL_46_20]
MKQKDIKQFIDFFHDTALRIRKQKPRIARGKDGKLVKRALTLFSRQQLEMLAVWFLAKKTKLSPTIGAMLSDVVLEELSRKMRSSSFWNDLDTLSERYFPRPINTLPLKTKHRQAFSLNTH